MNVPSCPFPGLLPFQERDAPYFFGRDLETVELLERLNHNRFVAVIGVSGSGKSSLVHAGLKPELRLANPPWRIAEMKPGGGPRRRLESALEVVLPGVAWRELLGRSSYGLVDGIAKAGRSAQEKLLIIVDQFEEIFSYRKFGHVEAEETDLFVQQLLRASTEPGAPLYVVLTMRTDYLGYCALFRNLAEALNEGTYLVPRLTRHEQEDAIRSPLAVSGIEIEAAVVDLLLNAAEANRDELPVLQHLLKRLWEEWKARGQKKISLADYEKTGGWDEAVTRDAESVFGPLNAAEQSAAKLVFQRLTEKGTGERAVRAPCSLAELTELTRPIVTSDQLRQILSAFRERDLLVWSEEAERGRERIDIPHECVTWRWTRLAEWIEEEDRDARRLAFIAESARAGTPLAGSALAEARALRARMADAWIDRYKLNAGELGRWVDHSEREAARARRRTRYAVYALALATILFAVLGIWAWQQKRKAETASNQAHSEQRRAQSAEQRAVDLAKLHEGEAQRAKTAELRAIDAAQRALDEQDRATRAEQQAVDRAKEAQARAKEGRARLGALLATHARQALTADPELAVLLALEAGSATTRYGEPRVPASERALREALAEVGGRILRFPEMHVGVIGDDTTEGMVVSADQRWLAVIVQFKEGDGWKTNVRLSRLNSRRLQSTVLRGARHPVAFTPDGRWLATGAVEGGIMLWDVRGAELGAEPRKLGPTGQLVDALTVSADGKWLAAAPPTQLWDLSAAGLPVKGIPISSAACVPATEGLASAGRTYVHISPDGRWLVSGGSYNVKGKAPPPWNPCLTDLRAESPATATRVLLGHDRSVTHAVFSSDGRRMATYSREGGPEYIGEDSNVRIWDLHASDPGAQPVAAVPALSTRGGGSVMLSDDGQWLVSHVTTDPVWVLPRHGQTQLWDLSRDPVSGPAFESQGRPIALGPPRNSDRWLVTVLPDDDATAILWNLKRDWSVASRWTLEREGSPVARAPRHAVNRNRRWLAMAHWDGTVELWDLASHVPGGGRRRFRVSNGLTRIGMDPEGRALSAGSGNAVRTWSLAQHNGGTDPVALRGEPFALLQDRWLIATADDETHINLWDLHDRAPWVPKVIADGPGVRPVALDPDLRWLVSWDRENRLRLWGIGSRDQPALLWSPTMVKAAKNSQSNPPVAFSANGRWLAAGFFDGSVQLRDMTAARVATMNLHEHDVVRVAFSNDSRWLFTLDKSGKGCLWPVPAEDKLRSRRCQGSLPNVRLGGRGRWLVNIAGGALRLWDLRRDDVWAEPLVAETGLKSVSDVLVDHDGRWLLARGDSLVLWRRQPHGSADGVTRLEPPTVPHSMHLSSDARWLATEAWGEVAVWDLSNPGVPRIIYRLPKNGSSESALLSFHRPKAGAIVLAVWGGGTSRRILGFLDPSAFADDGTRTWIEVPEGGMVSRTSLVLGPGNTYLTKDGRWTMTTDGSTIWLRRLRLQELLRLACDTSGRNLTDTEWQQYFPDQEFRRTCTTELTSR
jgi:WD40 repeat protein